MSETIDHHEEDILTMFRSTGALLHGHFILRSGLHSREFFQCALLLQNTGVASEVCRRLANLVRDLEFETVVSPAVGGIIVGQEVARHLGKRHIFVEKNSEGGLVMRRGFSVLPGERFIVAEDVVTRGGRVRETVDIIRSLGGVVVAAASIVDRSGGERADFGCPFFALVKMQVETFAADAIPEDLAAISAIKPGS
jgi:orotate phosphoribosyltransferase